MADLADNDARGTQTERWTRRRKVRRRAPRDTGAAPTGSGSSSAGAAGPATHDDAQHGGSGALTPQRWPGGDGTPRARASGAGAARAGAGARAAAAGKAAGLGRRLLSAAEVRAEEEHRLRRQLRRAARFAPTVDLSQYFPTPPPARSRHGRYWPRFLCI